MTEPVQAKDLFAIKTLSQPQVTDHTVYFLENRVDEATNTYQAVLKGLDMRNRHQTEFGIPGQSITKFALAPDETALLYLAADKQKKAQIYIQPLTGGSPYALTDLPDGVDDAAWSGDSQGVFFTNTSYPKKTPTKLPQPKTISRLPFLMNGQGVLREDGTHHLQYLPITGKMPKTLISRPDDFSLDAVDPSGRFLALSASPDPFNPKDFRTGTYLFEIATQNLTWITESQEHGEFIAADFSEDGTGLLLWGSDNHQPNIAENHIWYYDIMEKTLTDTAVDHQLEEGPGEVAADTQQKLSGRWAQYVTADYFLTQGFSHGRVSLYQASTDGELTEAVGGDRHITDYFVGADQHTVVYTYSDFQTPSCLAVYDLITEDEKDLYNPNTSWENHHELSGADEFTFQSDDDVTVEGWYMKPTGQAAEKSHPAILYIHGGPLAAYGYTFFHEMQVLTSAGYGVILINPRGSLSYGEDYAAGVIGAYGQGDYHDLMNGLDEVLKQDKHIDPKKLYVCGGSYGGFMTNWIETHTDRFAAAVTMRSISNWVSMYGNSDIGYFFNAWELQGKWYAPIDLDTYWKFSPLAYVDQAKTPILILHGEEDHRCPIGQGEEFYTSLKLHDVETEFVRYPGSNHELSRSGFPNLRIDRMNRIMDWFGKH
ncbi:MAG: S9 family peptidase [Schleiferilactobacillus perolens]|uniref:S9 family peptidase n=1 Tax=Schleiferilactobacillus perolens TaxID=100468 RepID=UPI0039E7FFD7